MSPPSWSLRRVEDGKLPLTSNILGVLHKEVMLAPVSSHILHKLHMLPMLEHFIPLRDSTDYSCVSSAAAENGFHPI